MPKQDEFNKLNRFKQVISKGEIAVGHMLFEFHTRGVALLLDAAGVDFVVIDMEHSSFSVTQVADLIAWLKATTIAPFVRIPEIQYQHIARVMDAGALGIVAPNVKTATEARVLVSAAKYLPVGKRGFFLGGANSNFQGVRPDAFRDFMDYANENTTVICMIESPEAIENLDDIASTPGVDALWVGWADLAQYMGIPGQFQDQRFLDAVKRIVGSAKRHGLPAMIQPGGSEQLKEWQQMGFNAISYSSDIDVYRNAMERAVAEVRKAVQG